MNFQGFLDSFSNAHDGDVHINKISTPLAKVGILVSKYDICSLGFLTASQVLVAQI